MTNENKVLIGIGAVTLFLVGIAVFTLGGNSGNTDETKKLEANEVEKLVREDSYKMGSDSAKVTLVEFGDFQCPACGSSHPVVAQLLNEYEGQVQFVFRNYPLQFHKNAMVAAQSAEAAGAQGKFYEMHDKLFENQKDWSESNKALDDHFVKYAEEIGVEDMDKFKKEVNDGKYKSKVERDISDGNSLGVSSTPTFYINGEEQVGGAPYNEFKQKIEAALKNEK